MWRQTSIIFVGAFQPQQYYGEAPPEAFSSPERKGCNAQDAQVTFTHGVNTLLDCLGFKDGEKKTKNDFLDQLATTRD